MHRTQRPRAVQTVYEGDRVAAFIDWDFAGPSSRAWDLCYAAHRFVPLSAPRSTKALGWDPASCDQAARLRIFIDAYDDGLAAADLVDLLIVRLASIATNIERNVRAGNSRFDRHRDERHSDGYREDMHYILERHRELSGA